MKIFIYKTAIIFILSLIFFKLTFIDTIKHYEEKILSKIGKEQLEITKIKIKKEIRNSLKKDRILKDEDAELMRLFIKKISDEIFNK